MKNINGMALKTKQRMNGEANRGESKMNTIQGKNA